MFRSSRPDYIETWRLAAGAWLDFPIVPVFQTGLH